MSFYLRTNNSNPSVRTDPLDDDCSSTVSSDSVESSEQSKSYQPSVTTIKTNRTVKYVVNPAVYVIRSIEEKSDTESPKTEENDLNVNVKSPHDNESLDSGCNLSRIYNVEQQLETDLFKREDAFKEWLVAKKNAKALEAKLKLEHEQREQLKKQQRKMETDAKLRQWLMAKNEMKKREINKTEQKPNSKHDNKCSTAPSNCKNLNYTKWLKEKQDEEKLRKLKQNQNAKLAKEYINLRSELSKIEYEKWKKESKTKQLPVPFSQGLASLRGCISHTFINPNPWVSIIDSEPKK